MAVKVVDASALAALLFDEPEAKAVADRLEDGNLVAPALLSFEIAHPSASETLPSTPIAASGMEHLWNVMKKGLLAGDTLR